MILNDVLNVPEVDKIRLFCDHVFSRQLALFDDFKDQFTNIYKERCFEYFTHPEQTKPAEVSRTIAQQSRRVSFVQKPPGVRTQESPEARPSSQMAYYGQENQPPVYLQAPRPVIMRHDSHMGDNAYHSTGS